MKINFNRKLRLRILFLMILILVIGICTKMYFFPRFHLPDQDGLYQVGEINLQLEDQSRFEVYTSDQSDHRRVMVTIWYPMKEAFGKTMEYPAEVTAAIRNVVGVPKWLFYHIQKVSTHIYEQGIPADLKNSSPLLLFSPGNNSTRFQNIAVIERLVGEGYTVVGVDHPYTSNDVSFLDGTVAKRNLSLGLKGDELYRNEIAIRTEDLNFVLQRLIENDSLVDAAVIDNIDFNHIGAFGHSYGGATIAELMAMNDSIDAGLSYDGGLWGSIVDKGFDKPFLYLSAEGTLDYRKDKDSERGMFVESVLENLKTAYKNSTSEVDYAVLQGYNHYSFTDLTLFSPLLAKGKNPLETTVEITLNYFDYWLKNERSYTNISNIFDKYEFIKYWGYPQ